MQDYKEEKREMTWDECYDVNSLRPVFTCQLPSLGLSGNRPSSERNMLLYVLDFMDGTCALIREIGASRCVCIR